MSEAYTLPDNTITFDPALAAEQWAAAFYRAKDALQRIRPVPAKLFLGTPIRDLDEILSECDSILKLGAD